MLHLVLNSHSPESCAFRGEEEEKALVGAIDGLEKAAADAGIQIKGTWINRAGHEFFVLVDAPNAHVVDEALLKTGLVGRTHSRIVPVLTRDEVFPGG